MEKGYLTKIELAKYLGVTVRYITTLTQQNKLPYYKPFGKNLYKIEEIDKLIELNKVKCV